MTDVLEEHLNTIGGVRSIRSTSYQGVALIVVEFDLGTDLDIAAQDVRDKVALARVALPTALDPPVVGTFNPNDTPVLWIPFDSHRPVVETSEAVRRTVSPYLETIPGVAGVAMFGRQDRNIRIWLDGDALRARGLAATDVLAALQREHVEMPGGSVESGRVDYAVKTDAEFRSVEEMRAARRRAPGRRAGAAARRRARRGRRRRRLLRRALQRQAHRRHRHPQAERRQHGRDRRRGAQAPRRGREGAAQRHQDVRRRRLHRLLAKACAKPLPRPSSRCVFGALLAVFTVFVFLRRTRPTLIVATAIPVSLIATFGLVYLAGFTLNTMTLLGMTLAVGVVIDDAIVVLENIERHRELGENAFEAASQGHPRDRLRGHRGDDLGGRGVPAGGLRAGPGRKLPGRLRAHGRGLRAALALRRADAHADARGAHAAPEPARARQRLPPARARLRLDRERTIGACSTGRSTTALRRSGSRSSRCFGACGLGSQLQTEFFPPADEGIFFARIEAAARHLARGHHAVPRARRAVVPRPARADRPVLGGRFERRRQRSCAPRRNQHGHDLRHDEAARRARAQRDAAGSRRAQGTRRVYPGA